MVLSEYYIFLDSRLCPNLNKRSRPQCRKDFFQARHKGKESLKLIGTSRQHNNGYRKSRNVLLVGKVLINGDECIELGSSQRQQRSVLHPTPTHFDCGFYGMRGQRPAKTAGYRLIKQQAHERRDAPSPLRAPLRPLHERLRESLQGNHQERSFLQGSRIRSVPARVFP